MSGRFAPRASADERAAWRARVRSWAERAAQSLASLQAKRPWWPLAIGFGLAILGGWRATRLELETRFEKLLPDHEPGVVELLRVEARVPASQSVFVVLEGPQRTVLRAMGDALVPPLRGLGEPWVASADDGVQAARAFLQPRASIFWKTDALRKLQGEIEARWDWEVTRATGANLDDDPPPPVDARALGAPFDASTQRFPDGYFESQDGRALVVVVRSSASGGELARARQALERIQAVVREVQRGADGPVAGVHVGYAGDLVTSLSEYGAVRDNLLSVGVLGVSLVLGVVFLFFFRLRALVAMGLTIGVGLACTFGLTQIAIGHLNVATGFLFSIVAGNGINFGILYMARFYEEIRAGASPERALTAAHSATWLSTLTAAVAAAASYGSLGATDFRAFRHFAFIGATGMLVCWVVTYAMLPALVVTFERVRPFAAGIDESTLLGRLRLRGVRFDRGFALLARRAPRAVALSGAALAALGLLALGPYLRDDPMQYNMRRLQNDAQTSREMYRLSAVAAGVLGANLEGSVVVLCDRTEQVAALTRALEARRDAAPPGEKPFEAVHTLFDFVPSEQAEKIPLALDIRERLLRARERGFLSPTEWNDVAPMLPPRALTPWTLEQLPDELARPFTERDGTRGRLVFIEPTAGKNDSDLRYLLRWANSFRETRLPDGSVIRGSGRAVIFADMLEAVQRDMPRAVALSLGMTLVAVVATFGWGSQSVSVVGALVVGLGWVAGAMALLGTKIDFFNFIALPITFGIGVDYAVNFVHRYRLEPKSGALMVLKEAGGPVILCSLTTMLGYLALLRSVNQAIRGLGRLAVMGEVSCLLAAVLVLPAALVWRERSRRQPAVSPGAGVLPERAS